MGTPLYMSPEQAQGHAVDHRSDLYSLGVTFYHMLAGVPPFRAETALALALKQVREAPRSMLVYRADLPPELDGLVLKLMAKSPVDRYQSAGEMLADLTKLRDVLHIGTAPTFTDAGSLAADEAPGSSRVASGTSAAAAAAAPPVGAGRAFSCGQPGPDRLGKPLAPVGGVDRGDHVRRPGSGWPRRVDQAKSGRDGGSLRDRLGPARPLG